MFDHSKQTKMNDDEHLPSQRASTRTSRLSSYSKRHFDYFDPQHSVFSRQSYYDDMHSTHPWMRRSYSPSSGIPLFALRTRSCSSRLDELARPKIKRERLIRQEYFDNIHNYAYSGVTSTALTAHCSDRLAALAHPKKRTIRIRDSNQGSKDALKTRGNIVLMAAAWKKK